MISNQHQHRLLQALPLTTLQPVSLTVHSRSPAHVHEASRAKTQRPRKLIILLPLPLTTWKANPHVYTPPRCWCHNPVTGNRFGTTIPTCGAIALNLYMFLSYSFPLFSLLLLFVFLFMRATEMRNQNLDHYRPNPPLDALLQTCLSELRNLLSSIPSISLLPPICLAARHLRPKGLRLPIHPLSWGHIPLLPY